MRGVFVSRSIPRSAVIVVSRGNVIQILRLMAATKERQFKEVTDSSKTMPALAVAADAQIRLFEPFVGN